MKCVKRYEANDGSTHTEKESALRRDADMVAVQLAMVLLGDLPEDDSCKFANGDGYIQHKESAVISVKASLCALAETKLPDWFEKQRNHPDADGFPMKTDIGWFLRMLEGSCPPLERGFSRLYCIDDKYREWGQPYYAMHPDEASGQYEVER